MKKVTSRRDTLMLLGAGGLALAWFSSGTTRKSAPSFNVPEVDLAQAKTLIEAGAMVIDVRGKEAFDYRHLPLAMFIPLAILQAKIPASLEQAKERQIVVYCNDGHTSGPEAANILMQHGYKNVVNLKPGIEGWANAGLPLVKAS